MYGVHDIAFPRIFQFKRYGHFHLLQLRFNWREEGSLCNPFRLANVSLESAL